MTVRRLWTVALVAACGGAARPSDDSAPLPTAAAPQVVDACPALPLTPPDIEMGPEDRPVPAIVDLGHLAPFFERTATLLRGRARDHVRIAVYGDSNLTMDYLTGHMRRWLQLRYGDAGHGFVALARPWNHYLHMDVRHGASSGWEKYAITTDPVIDRMYGLSGIAAESLHKDAVSWVATADASAPIGTRVGRADVFFLKGTRFGDFHVDVDGQRRTTVGCSAADTELGVERIELADGPHEVSFIAADPRHRTRLLGVALERAEPGFVIDSYGVGSLNTVSHARQHPEISGAMLRARAYDLIILTTGANDPFTIERVPEAMARVIQLHREALPGVPILMLTPADRGKRRTFAGTLKVIEQRKELARTHGTAFWNLFEALGGPSSMARLYRRGLVKNDYIHFTDKGGEYAAKRLLSALWRGLDAYVAAHPRAGCADRVLSAKRTSVSHQ
jgi:hypothetical protein